MLSHVLLVFLIDILSIVIQTNNEEFEWEANIKLDVNAIKNEIRPEK